MVSRVDWQHRKLRYTHLQGTLRTGADLNPCPHCGTRIEHAPLFIRDTAAYPALLDSLLPSRTFLPSMLSISHGIAAPSQSRFGVVRKRSLPSTTTNLPRPRGGGATGQHSSCLTCALVSLASLRAPPRRLARISAALSPTMTHGNMGTWGKQEGDEIVAGDVVCEVETDKAVRCVRL